MMKFFLLLGFISLQAGELPNIKPAKQLEIERLLPFFKESIELNVFDMSDEECRETIKCVTQHINTGQLSRASIVKDQVIKVTNGDTTTIEHTNPGFFIAYKKEGKEWKCPLIPARCDLSLYEYLLNH